ncbi:hypothetical protein [Oceanisphaera sp. KMM 10153]|uniref:hypothetical protein n=1 Tax=Oceanisphaera submarina TaxID=3390193 RepID=UPI00397505E6
MKLTKKFIGIVFAIFFANYVSAEEATVNATGTCKLTSTAASKTLYEGSCKIKQTINESDYSVFEITMGSAESFLFAGTKGQKDWMHGPDKVEFTDLPTGAIFRWSDFALVVAL